MKCNRCYWKHSYKNDCLQDCEINSDGCKEFNQKCDKCDCDIAGFKYKGKYLCFDCLLEELDTDTGTVKEYYIDGECIGNDSDIASVTDHILRTYEVEELKEDLENIKNMKERVS